MNTNMKLQVNLSKNKILFSILFILILGGFVFAYAFSSSGTGGTPSVFGHSIDEMDWSKVIPILNAKSINASQTNTSTLCLNGDCKNAWPVSNPGTNTYTCATAQNGNCFVGCPAGSSPVSVSGCKTMTVSGNGYNCQPEIWQSCTCTLSCSINPNSPITLPLTCPTGQVLKGLTITGAPNCVVDQTAISPTTCTWSGRVYSSGTTCWSSSQCGGNQDTTIQHCSSGSWSSSTVRTQTPCPYSSC